MLLQKNPPTTPTHALYPRPLAATLNPNSLPRATVAPCSPPPQRPCRPAATISPPALLLRRRHSRGPPREVQVRPRRLRSGEQGRHGATRCGRALPAGQRPAKGRTGTARAKALPASPPPRRPRRACPPPRREFEACAASASLGPAAAAPAAWAGSHAGRLFNP
jgi:hypothetical protein